MKYSNPIFLVILLFICLQACKQAETSQPVIKNENNSENAAEAYSLNGTPLFPMKESPSTFHRKDSLLKIAIGNFESDPQNLDNIIWYGRRLAYLSRYKEAIDVYTKGMISHPEAPELFRHRGHRYISTRKFDLAIIDFDIAADLIRGRAIEIEPDGIPNKLNIPLSNTQFNIYYHLALAHYLKGNFHDALAAYDSCMVYSDNPDLLVATADWRYMTLRRLGKDIEASSFLERIPNDLEIIENDSYYKRIKMYKGQIEPSELLDFENPNAPALDIVTQGYGVANWFLYNGETEQANAIFKKILESDYWSAFGYIAAEADYYRATR